MIFDFRLGHIDKRVRSKADRRTPKNCECYFPEGKLLLSIRLQIDGPHFLPLATLITEILERDTYLNPMCLNIT